MAIKPGAHLGPYEILSSVGAGGMGEVYKAKDTRLDRVVAIKVLAPQIAERLDVRQRFEREARTVAALNHPHICVLHDIGRQDQSAGSGPAIHFLVMEYLEGESLAARLAKGPLALDQALRYATEIADALAKAHRQGVTHRDLKPANIMLTKAGAKLLDFGLAKTAEPSSGRGQAAPSSLDTREAAPRNDLTAEGTILGTVQYMAPEQLEGRDADARTDIFALGSCIYEMITGRKAFEGTSQASVISAIMSSEPPPIASLQPMTPNALDRLVRNCLAKDPDERWQTAHDVRLQLRAIREASDHVEAAASAAKPRSRERLVWLALAGVLIAVIAAQWIRVRPASTNQSAVRLSILPPPHSSFGGGITPSWPVISPDGTRLALVVTGADGQSSLWIRPIDSVSAQSIAGTQDASFPFWSPDGGSVGFFANGKLKTVGLTGGAVQTLCDAISGGGTWNRDGIIVFSVDDSTGLRRVAATGGECRVLTNTDPSRAEILHRSPHFLPDGRHYLYSRVSGQSKDRQFGVYLGSLDSAQTSLLLPDAKRAVFAPPDHLLFDAQQTLMAQTFDPDRLELSSQPQPVADLVAPDNVWVSASDTGIVAYREGSAFSTYRLTWFDRAGNRVNTLGPPAVYGNPRISPDGQRVAVAKQDGSNVDVWIMDVSRGTAQRLTFDPAHDNVPVWSPDGNRIVLTSNRGGQFEPYQTSLSGAGSEALLLKADTGVGLAPYQWSSDGRVIVLGTIGFGGNNVLVLPTDGDRKPAPLLVAPFNEMYARLSPDGRGLLYSTDESGRSEVYVQGFSAAAAKTQISTTGGDFPTWRGDGKEVFYLNRGQLMAVDVVIGNGAIKAEAPHALFKVDVGGTPTQLVAGYYDVTSDGQRFLFNIPDDSSGSAFTVLLNWPALLKH